MYDNLKQRNMCYRYEYIFNDLWREYISVSWITFYKPVTNFKKLAVKQENKLGAFNPSGHFNLRNN